MGRSGSYQLHHSQNFLRRTSLADRLIQEADIGHDDLVIDIGAGGGILTAALARRARQVIAIEQDANLVRELSRRFHDDHRVCVFACDALAFPMPHTPFKVFANIPFRNTSAIMEKLTTGASPPDDMWLVVQNEAAKRYLPGEKMTMVATAMAPWFDVSVAHRFDRRDFRPSPGVDSVLLRVTRRRHPSVPEEDRDRFRLLVEGAFTAWQPTLAKAIDSRLPRRAAQSVTDIPGLDISRRPSHVDLDTWITVFRALVERNDNRVWEALGRASDDLRRQQSSLDRPTSTPNRKHRPGSR